ncbi:hypothetical protein GWK08_00025 [Leptobacterium flavescens]|uniref:S-adenosyl-L-homocysteine hydrolase NAD binding domain-containing protein n=1 Tax=Leptobacterium flavescens TaxID=472055 RepID=A0A6P0UEZ5_9FLAO|nr:NAD-binding protein [Leptobacterium flavescens]NER11815.1 hypothetical protein [Leptobacterium flavescens]
METLLKVEVLLLGGAELTVTSPSFMDPDPRAIQILEEAGVNIQLDHNFTEEYDILMDCAGELFGKAKARLGVSEITRTGTLKYGESELEYPVISVDSSVVKNLEGVLGTGEAFVRAFKILSKEEIENKQFLIFGYGKVGRGMAHALKPYTDKIVVVDKNPAFIEQAKEAGFKAIQADEKATIESEARNSFAIATATGIKDVVSANYDASAFKGKYLANMGGEDEFGNAFDTEEVMCQKYPINFFVDKPTLMKYLDPVFYAHNTVADILLYNDKLPKKLHPFPSYLAEEIVQDWIGIFGENPHI